MIRMIIAAVVFIYMQGCSSFASMSDFEKSSAEINFKEKSNINFSKSGIWTWDGTDEYFFRIGSDSEKELYKEIEHIIGHSGYKVVKSDEQNKVILARKLITLNEWYSISGTYIKKDTDSYQVYIKVKVTQDITGGATENRAEQLGRRICQITRKCIIK